MNSYRFVSTTIAAAMAAAVACSPVWAAAPSTAPTPASGPAVPGPLTQPALPAAQPSFFDQEMARFTRLAGSGEAELQVEAAQGFGNLGYFGAEPALLGLAGSTHELVRLEAVRALTVCGGRAAVPVLIDRLDDPHWQIAQLAREGLERMTDAPAAGWSTAQWRQWLAGSDWQAKEDALLARLAEKAPERALPALEALTFVGSARCEKAVLAHGQGLGRPGARGILRCLERFGTPACMPWLVQQAPHHREASWALGRIGGPQAEEALLAGMRRWRTHTLDTMINLDRLGSTRCEPFLPELLRAFGLVIFRSYVDELHLPPSAYQRVAASLILRTGKAPQVVDLVLQEAEGRRKEEQTPENLRQILAAMREELKPGFVRNDGVTVAQPLAALPHLVRDPALAGRLIPLLKHPAFIVRIYVAEALAALHCGEAAGPILAVVREPYPFVDEATHVSGKHFGDSQIVRWRGYLCISLGKLGGDEARTALEQIAANAGASRDLRYGSVVGLGFLGSPKSLSVLEQVAQRDIVWNIRQAARQAMDEIRVSPKK